MCVRGWFWKGCLSSWILMNKGSPSAPPSIRFDQVRMGLFVVGQRHASTIICSQSTSVAVQVVFAAPHPHLMNVILRVRWRMFLCRKGTTRLYLTKYVGRNLGHVPSHRSSWRNENLSQAPVFCCDVHGSLCVYYIINLGVTVSCIDSTL